MSSLTQTTSWLYSLQSTKFTQPKSTHFHPKNHKITSFNTLKILAFAADNSKEQSLPEPISSNVTENSEASKPDRVKLAFQRAQKYKNSLVLNQVKGSTENPVAEFGSKDVPAGNQSLSGDGDIRKEEIPEVNTSAMEKDGKYQNNEGLANSDPDDKNDRKEEVPEAMRVAMEKAREYKKNKGKVNNDKSSKEIDQVHEDKDDGNEEVPDAVRIAMEKAKEYKKNKGKVDDVKSYEERNQLHGSGEVDVPEAVRIAMGKSSEYKKNKGVTGRSDSYQKSLNLTGLIEDGTRNSRDKNIEKSTNKKDDPKISSIDFVGLGFADKKSGRGLPAGLVPVADPFPDNDSQEVEFIRGDASMFGNPTSSETEKISEESSDLYKPKVSTWGMFPRPSNISETFGGGRTLRPGEALETAEDRATREAQTNKLLAAYKRKFGLNMDPKLKAECQKALNDGDSLMDGGRLKEALPYYQKVMDNLPFQTELHGLAALQWSICQDSLTRTEEARIMYDKLQSHPTGQVNKKARQFMFSFQAMEMMKVTQSTVSPKNTDYGTYFEAFVEDKVNYSSESTDDSEDAISQVLPYIIFFLASPILLVLLVAASKGM